ncbi:FAD-binding oxidoreductase [Uliginosibacterium sediminicola]|uniref:FAD-binding oxidoreductase n=1 Tax=Uliginosibacterium sediminicola TaxID=2024550 RepID=A0ABU9YXG7_9RHOO
MTRSVIVLGAGMVGVSTALHLQARGHDVLLLDRKAPGRETSYGNAGLIQREAVEPYPLPREPADLLQHAFGLNAAVSYHWRALPSLLPRLAAYWYHSSPKRHARISRDWSTLIAHATSEHAEWIVSAGAQDLVKESGFRLAFRHAQSYAKGVAKARHYHDTYGVRFEALDSDALSAAEPALQQRFAGGVHWVDPWAVNDPGELVARYAALYQRRGGRLVSGDASTLRQTSHGWQVITAEGPQQASDVVVALGPWADDLIRPLGYHLPLFVKRGYHRHYQVERQLEMAVLCADDGVMLAPMSAGLRITTGAELALRDAPPSPVQLAMAEKVAARALALGAPLEATPWIGARPCTTDMKPVIGAAARHPGLWFNFGHAHQGFTLGPASGRLLADLFDSQTPFIKAEPFAPARFGA